MIFNNNSFGNLKILKIDNVDFCWNRRAPKFPEDPFNKFLKFLNMGSIPSKKYGMEILENLEYEINIYETS